MQHSIRFVLDDRIIEIDFSKASVFKPTTTVLNYLRSIPGHKGVKEGCAEGDCGACTVVVAEPGSNGKLIYETVDSCLLFLPMIHGKQLITIENLAVSNRDGMHLHPVQEEMVVANGSQCGYCTPGVVMSLFGVYKNHPKPVREEVQEALVGNLCRCTGYQPIIEAAMKACQDDRQDHFSKNEKAVVSMLEEIRKNKDSIELTSVNQKYFRPSTIEDALIYRNQHPESIIINGATDIALRQTKKHESLVSILDLSGIKELRSFYEEGNTCIFGAGFSIEATKNASKDRFPALYCMMAVFGSLQIRNLATIGGNICSASPIGDTLPVLLAYGAKVKLKSIAGERIIDLEKFITGYRKTGIRPDELLTGVMIPKPGEGVKILSYKVSRRKDLDISTVSACFRLHVKNENVDELVLAYGGMSAFTKRSVKTEQYLLGKKWSKSIIQEAMKILSGEFEPLSDARSEADYRSKVAGNLLLRFYLDTTSED